MTDRINSAWMNGQPGTVHLLLRSCSSPDALRSGFRCTPAWSPDGSKIAFTSYRVGDVKQIFTYTLATGAITDLSNDTSAADASPDWSPDGTHLIFTSDRTTDAGGIQTWQMKADGTGKIDLSDYAGGAYDGAYSPDGNSITFAGNDRVGGLFQVETQLIGGTAGAVTAEPQNSGDGHMSWQPARAEIAAVGDFYAVSPTRVLDTRSGLGAPAHPVGAGGVVQVQLGGVAGVPASGVSAVVLNVTVTGTTAGGYLTVYPAGVSRPTASNINFDPGATLANSVTVALGSAGKVAFYNSGGKTDVVADVIGFYAADDTTLSNPRFGYPGGHTIGLAAPIRSLDTRSGGGPIPAGHTRSVPVNLGSTVNSHVHALLVNVTVVTPKSGGYVTLWNARTTRPGTSTLNFPAGAPAVTNFAIIPVTGDGTPTVDIYNASSAALSVVLDVFGYVDDTTIGGGLTFHPITPTRIVDSRSALGLTSALTAGKVGVVTTPAAVGTASTKALALNVTAISPSTSTYLTLYADGITRPNSSNLNPAPGTIVANAALTTLSSARRFDIFNAGGTVNIVIDVAGYYQSTA